MIIFELMYTTWETICDWVTRDKEYCDKTGKTFKTMWRSNWSLWCDIKESSKHED